MVSTASALNHDERVAPPPQIERDAPPDGRALSAAAVDAEHEVARLEADLRGAAAGPHGFDQEAGRVGRPERERRAAARRARRLRRPEWPARAIETARSGARARSSSSARRLAGRRALEDLVELARRRGPAAVDARHHVAARRRRRRPRGRPRDAAHERARAAAAAAPSPRAAAASRSCRSRPSQTGDTSPCAISSCTTRFATSIGIAKPMPCAPL